MAHILVVEDELSMQMGIRDNLEFEGYQVDVASDGEEGLKHATAGSYDLIVSDVMMPKMSGFDMCKKLRADGVKTPVIMLTAKGEEIDRVLGLELGADDYITKPFSLRELLARIKAVLRRTANTAPQPKEESQVQIGKLHVNFEAYEASSDGREVGMSHKEFELLKYFRSNSNKTITRDELLNEVWGYDAPTTRTVDNFILKLRQKIEENPSSPKHILTVHGVGYKFIG